MMASRDPDVLIITEVPTMLCYPVPRPPGAGSQPGTAMAGLAYEEGKQA